jgi:hypothetical protein
MLTLRISLGSYKTSLDTEGIDYVAKDAPNPSIRFEEMKTQKRKL